MLYYVNVVGCDPANRSGKGSKSEQCKTVSETNRSKTIRKMENRTDVKICPKFKVFEYQISRRIHRVHRIKVIALLSDTEAKTVVDW